MRAQTRATLPFSLALALLACVLALAPACAQRPARRVPEAGVLPPALSQQPSVRTIDSGAYDAIVATSITGRLRARMLVTNNADGTLDARTPEGVAWNYVGGITGSVGPLIVPWLFPGGSILTWESTQPGVRTTGETVDGEGTIGVAWRDSLRLRTRTRAHDGYTEVMLRDGRVAAVFALEPVPDAAATPVTTDAASSTPTDYTALSNALADGLRDKLYDPALTRRASLRAFRSDLQAASLTARDDLEYLFALGAAARAHLASVPPFLYPAPPAEADPYLQGVRSIQPVQFEPAKDDPSGRVHVLRVDAFADDTALAQALAALAAQPPAALVLDLRNCVGGDLTSLAFASALLHQPADAGIWFGAGARDAVLKGNAPQAPPLVVQSLASARAAHEHLRATGLLIARVEPAPGAFAGPLVILTTSRTASTAETLVSLLRTRPRTTILGAPTAGRPRVSDEFDAGQGWLMRFGVYDWRPGTTTLAAPARIRPDRTAEREQALAKGVELLLQQLDGAGETPR